MANGLKPDLWVKNIYDIDFDKLKEKGVKALFFDIDNTLVAYSDRTSNKELDLWFEKVLDEGFKIGFLSNANDKRIEHFADGVMVKGEKILLNPNFKLSGSARKPLRWGYKNLAKAFNLDPSDIAMIGDQLFTDIWGGNRFGCITVLVDPINKDDDHWFVAFKRIFEKHHLRKFKKK